MIISKMIISIMASSLEHDYLHYGDLAPMIISNLGQISKVIISIMAS